MKACAFAGCFLCICVTSVRNHGLVKRQCLLLSFTLVFEWSQFDREDPLQAGIWVRLPFTHQFVPLAGTASCPGWSCLFPVPALESAVCPRSPGSFDGGTVSRNQGPAHTCPRYRVSAFLGPWRTDVITQHHGVFAAPSPVACPVSHGARAPGPLRWQSATVTLPLSSALTNRGISGLVSFLYLLGLNKICCPEYLK